MEVYSTLIHRMCRIEATEEQRRCLKPVREATVRVESTGGFPAIDRFLDWGGTPYSQSKIGYGYTDYILSTEFCTHWSDLGALRGGGEASSLVRPGPHWRPQVCHIELPSDQDPDFWLLRGVAAFLVLHD